MCSKKSDVCHVCGHTFTQTRALRRHLRTVHHIGNELTCVCEICKKFFSRKENLKRHMEFFHLDEPKPSFECYYCGCCFPRRDSLVRHVRTHMERNNFTEKIRGKRYNIKRKVVDKNKTYECNECRKIFTRRKGIVVHLRNGHKFTREFECNLCKRAYCSKHRLLEHIRAVHESKENLTCPRCSRNFVKAESLKQHVEKCFKREKVSNYTATVLCVLCGAQFPAKYALSNHYENEHSIAIQTETLEFNSREEFEKWKCKLEVATITQYTSRRVCRTTKHEYRAYECHRSGIYKENTQKPVRLRNLKKQGSKKLQGACPAEIKFKQFKSNGKCTVTFQSTHVGHEIGNETELAHIYLDKAKRDEIVGKIIDHVPPLEIIKEEKEALENGTCNNRKRSLQRKDLHNIERKHVINLFPIDKDYENVTVFVVTNEANILYYKEQQKNTTVIDVLQSPPDSCPFLETDFVLIYFDATQKEKLTALMDGGVVCIGSTSDTNPYDFTLMTIMVLNLNNEGIPVAYALTSRTDDVFVTVFLKCVKTVIGDVQIKTFMSNQDPIYHKCWSNVFSIPETWLYCSQEVSRCWKQHMLLIQNEKVQQNVRSVLRSLQREMNEKQFKQSLEKFLNDPDPVLQEFLTYFINNYAGTVEKWAYCYRMHAGINKNDCLHAFHERLKKGKIKSIAEELHYMRTFLNQKLQISNENSLEKLQSMKKAHEEAETCRKDYSISMLSEGYWQMDSGRQCISIQKVDPRCASVKLKSVGETCLLRCPQCDACVHQYQCSCQDSAIHQNICKHIHLLVMLLNEEAVSSSTADVVVMQDYYYVAADGSVVNILEGVVEDDTNFHQDIEDTLTRYKDLLFQRVKNKEEWLQIKNEFLAQIEAKLDHADQPANETFLLP